MGKMNMEKSFAWAERKEMPLYQIFFRPIMILNK